jgi:hypothetical protein
MVYGKVTGTIIYIYVVVWSLLLVESWVFAALENFYFCFPWCKDFCLYQQKKYVVLCFVEDLLMNVLSCSLD